MKVLFEIGTGKKFVNLDDLNKKILLLELLNSYLVEQVLQINFKKVN
jgi:hypothetical protein